MALPGHFAPGRGTAFQHLGAAGAVIRCEGAFLGGSPEECARQLGAFLAVAKQRTPGTLLLPALEPISAFVSAASFSQEGEGDCILYTIEFVENAFGQMEDAS